MTRLRPTPRPRPALPALLLALAFTLPACQRAPKPTAESAVELVQSHYRKISEKRFQEAYNDWADSGKASGKSYIAFLNGYVQTPRVEVTTGTPGRIEGAAGSRFVTVPVRVAAYKPDGGREDFAGSYVLRYSVVEGANPRWQWRLYEAKLERATPADSTS
jgi:hypothetical protein